MRRLNPFVLVLACAITAHTASAEIVTDGIISVDVFNSGQVGAVTLDGAYMTTFPYQFTGTCAGLSMASDVTVSGAVATFSGECGSFDVDATVRLLGPVPSVAASGGYEQEFVFTNTSGAPLPLNVIMGGDIDISLQSGNDVVAYDPASQAVFVYDADNRFTALLVGTDDPDAVRGWDVAQLGSLDATFPMPNDSGPIGPTDIALAHGIQAAVPNGKSVTVWFRHLWASSITSVPADFDFSSCYTEPVDRCRIGEKSLLALKNSSDDDNDSIKWKLSKAQATAQADYADPAGDGDYSLCVYNADARMLSLHVPASSAWEETGTKGFLYKDPSGASSGVTKISLKGSAEDKAKLLLTGSGAGLPDPGVGPFVAPLAVQLNNGGNPGKCWSATYATTVKNSPSQVKAKVP